MLFGHGDPISYKTGAASGMGQVLKWCNASIILNIMVETTDIKGKGKVGPIAYWPLGRQTVRGSPCLGHRMEGGAHPSPSAAFPSLN